MSDVLSEFLVQNNNIEEKNEKITFFFQSIKRKENIVFQIDNIFYKYENNWNFTCLKYPNCDNSVFSNPNYCFGIFSILYSSVYYHKLSSYLKIIICEYLKLLFHDLNENLSLKTLYVIKKNGHKQLDINLNAFLQKYFPSSTQNKCYFFPIGSKMRITNPISNFDLLNAVYLGGIFEKIEIFLSEQFIIYMSINKSCHFFVIHKSSTQSSNLNRSSSFFETIQFPKKKSISNILQHLRIQHTKFKLSLFDQIIIESSKYECTLDYRILSDKNDAIEIYVFYCEIIFKNFIYSHHMLYSLFKCVISVSSDSDLNAYNNISTLHTINIEIQNCQFKGKPSFFGNFKSFSVFQSTNDFSIFYHYVSNISISQFSGIVSLNDKIVMQLHNSLSSFVYTNSNSNSIVERYIFKRVKFIQDVIIEKNQSLIQIEQCIFQKNTGFYYSENYQNKSSNLLKRYGIRTEFEEVMITINFCNQKFFHL